jgi:two-component system response regulator FixJ
VVDDDAGVRDSMRVLLEVLGADVQTYDSGGDFLRESPHVDCLIVDYHMPGLNGLELVLELRRRGQSPPVVLISAASDPPLERRAAAAGITKVLKKSAGAQALLRAIREELG